MTNYFVEIQQEMVQSNSTLHTTFYIKATSFTKARKTADSLNVEAGAIVVKVEKSEFKFVPRGQIFARRRTFTI